MARSAALRFVLMFAAHYRAPLRSGAPSAAQRCAPRHSYEINEFTKIEKKKTKKGRSMKFLNLSFFDLEGIGRKPWEATFSSFFHPFVNVFYIYFFFLFSVGILLWRGAQRCASRSAALRAWRWFLISASAAVAASSSIWPNTKAISCRRTALERSWYQNPTAE